MAASGGGHLHADNTQLAAGVSNMDATSADIRALMSAINGYVAEVSGTSWAGEANVAFQSAMTRWHEAAVRMDRVLQDIHDGVHMSKITHETQEDSNVSELTRAGQTTFGINA